MALEVLSGSVYRGTAANVQKTEIKPNEVSIQESGTAGINVTDVPAATKTSSSGQNGDKGQKEQSASEKQIKDAISRANNTMKNHRTRCEFSYHEETNRVSIKVMDKETEEVIREIPPEETLEMIERMWELAGILIDERR